MRSYVILFAVSFVLSLVMTPFVRRKAIEWGAVDLPGGRRIHLRPTPRLGGIAIFLSFVATLLCVPLLGNMVSDTFRGSLPRLIALFIPATFIFLFGIYDDFRGSSATLKIAAQSLAGTFVWASGFRIEKLSMLSGGSWELPAVVGFLLTLLWIIGITNAFNLIDGVDGLAAGASVFAMLSILVFSIVQGSPDISLVAVVLVGAVIGFLPYNFNPATIFLGDSGSLFLGFMAAVLSMVGSQKGSTIVAIAIPLVSFGLPVMEAALSLVRRFLSGAPLFDSDRGHIHHMLLRRGLSQRQVVILLYGVCALFSLFGLMLLNPARNLAALLFFVLGVGIVFGVQHLRYTEFSELGSQIRREVLQRRRALAVNVRVRQISSDLAENKTIEQFFGALEGLLAVNEFDCALLEINEAKYSVRGVEAFAPGGRRRLPASGFDKVVWTWERGGTPLDEILASDQFWTLRLPMTEEDGTAFGAITFYRCLLDGEPSIDLKNLCGPLRRELSATLACLLKECPAPAGQSQAPAIRSSELVSQSPETLL
ncbi:MAG TPA: MraY family glycosyltransferase [Blastocatellia bacterium]|nr:MraY family glycosyltransferase [Blastocatellia bacterium]